MPYGLSLKQYILTYKNHLQQNVKNKNLDSIHNELAYCSKAATDVLRNYTCRWCDFQFLGQHRNCTYSQNKYSMLVLVERNTNIDIEKELESLEDGIPRRPFIIYLGNGKDRRGEKVNTDSYQDT